MMIIEIFNVGHGACSVITFPNGRRVMIDCGCDGGRPWFPSVRFRSLPIDLLVIQNLDSDHLQDIDGVLGFVAPRAIYSNPTVEADVLTVLKAEHGMDGPLRTMHALLAKHGPRIGPWAVPLPAGVEAKLYWLPYHPANVDGTNNLSVVLSVRYGPFRIVFGGDMERRGWRDLLSDFAFWPMLMGTNVFVASHHGRESGLCDEALSMASPDIVVISDKEKVHASQETVDQYRRYCRGIPDHTRAPSMPLAPLPLRHVLTTRKDGDLRIEVQPDGSYWVWKSGVAQERPFSLADFA